MILLKNCDLRGWSRSESGSVAIMFALMSVAALLFVGLAVDYGQMVRIHSEVASAADHAALAGAVDARTNLLKTGENNSSKTDSILKDAEKSAAAFFDAQRGAKFTSSKDSQFSVKLSGREITSTVGFEAVYKPAFMSLAGYSDVKISGQATAKAVTVPYIDVTLLVDTSGSMAIGADVDDQTLLKNKIGCAFACHDSVPVNGHADAYAYALAQGITLRYQAVNDGILALIEKFKALDPSGKAITASIWSFDTSYTQRQATTSNWSKLVWGLPEAPATSGETEGATKFNEAIGAIAKTIKDGGDGLTAEKPIRLLIIATDGVQDPGRFWVSKVAYRTQVAPFSMSFCGALKARNIKVGILHTPYLPMTYDWGYNATLGQPSQLGNGGTRGSDVPIVLKDCAGSLYMEAGSRDRIVSGFVGIVDAAVSTRLSN